MQIDVNELFNRRIMMAPMSGVNTPAFCEMLRENGCGFIYTGLITSHGVTRKNCKSRQILKEFIDGVTLVGQLFGAVPEVMADAAQVVLDTGKIDFIDINMGCPVPKVVRTCAGASLMREPELAGRIVRAVVDAVDVPVTVKTRSGWSDGDINYLEIAKIVQDNGAAAIALHPRTRRQGYAGEANWEHIARLKEEMDIPVIASGDVKTPEDAERCFSETGCDSIMVGRAAMGDPGLIARIQKYIDTGELDPPPDYFMRLANLRRHLNKHVADLGELRAVREMRSSMPKYIKGMPGASVLRGTINRVDKMEEVLELLDRFEEHLKQWLEDREGNERTETSEGAE